MHQATPLPSSHATSWFGLSAGRYVDEGHALGVRAVEHPAQLLPAGVKVPAERRAECSSDRRGRHSLAEEHPWRTGSPQPAGRRQRLRCVSTTRDDARQSLVLIDGVLEQRKPDAP